MHHLVINRIRGFSILDLLIILSIIFAGVVVGTPLYTKYSIQVRVAEAIAEADRARSIATTYCMVNPVVVELSSAPTGYVLHPSDYVESLKLHGSCAAPTITLVTRNTGASPDPIIVLNGTPGPGSSKLEWACSSSGSDSYIPESCQKANSSM